MVWQADPVGRPMVQAGDIPMTNVTTSIKWPVIETTDPSPFNPCNDIPLDVVERLGDAGDVGLAGHHHHPDVPERLVGAYRAQQREAVHLRQVRVHEDQIERPRAMVRVKGRDRRAPPSPRRRGRSAPAAGRSPPAFPASTSKGNNSPMYSTRNLAALNGLACIALCLLTLCAGCKTRPTAPPVVVRVPEYVPRPAICAQPLQLTLPAGTTAAQALQAQAELLARYRALVAACGGAP